MPGLTVRVMAPDFSPEQYAASVRMMRQMAPGILCLLFAEMYLIFFHAEKKFAYPHGAEALQKIGWGVAILVGAKLLGWHDWAIGVGYSAAAALQLSITVFGMYRSFGWALRSCPLGEWWARWGGKASLLVLPLVVGIAGAVFRDWMSHWVQSRLGEVSYVSVEFARQLANLPKAFLGQIISMVMLPHLASILHSHGQESHRRTIEVMVETLSLLSIPVMAAMVVLAPELMSLIFIPPKWGEPEHELCVQGALAMRMIAMGFGFMVLESVLLPGLFSIQSMWWPIMWGLAASGVQIVATAALAMAGLPANSLVLIGGVAFLYPFSRILKNGILLLVLRRKTQVFPGRMFALFVTKMAGLLALCTVLGYATHKLAAPWLGPLPIGEKMMVYKIKLALQIGVPSAVILVGFLGATLALGYGTQLMELIRSVRNRKKAPPANGEQPAIEG